MGNTILPSGEELNSTPEEILRYLNPDGLRQLLRQERLRWHLKTNKDVTYYEKTKNYKYAGEVHNEGMYQRMELRSFPDNGANPGYAGINNDAGIMGIPHRLGEWDEGVSDESQFEIVNRTTVGAVATIKEVSGHGLDDNGNMSSDTHNRAAMILCDPYDGRAYLYSNDSIDYVNNETKLPENRVPKRAIARIGDIPTRATQLINDLDFITDPDYNHTDNNFTHSNRFILDNLDDRTFVYPEISKDENGEYVKNIRTGLDGKISEENYLPGVFTSLEELEKVDILHQLMDPNDSTIQGSKRPYSYYRFDGKWSNKTGDHKNPYLKNSQVPSDMTVNIPGTEPIPFEVVGEDFNKSQLYQWRYNRIDVTYPIENIDVILYSSGSNYKVGDILRYSIGDDSIAYKVTSVGANGQIQTGEYIPESENDFTSDPSTNGIAIEFTNNSSIGKGAKFIIVVNGVIEVYTGQIKNNLYAYVDMAPTVSSDNDSPWSDVEIKDDQDGKVICRSTAAGPAYSGINSGRGGESTNPYSSIPLLYEHGGNHTAGSHVHLFRYVIDTENLSYEKINGVKVYTGKWVDQGPMSVENPADIKALLLSNSDTNNFNNYYKFMLDILFDGMNRNPDAVVSNNPNAVCTPLLHIDQIDPTEDRRFTEMRIDPKTSKIIEVDVTDRVMYINAATGLMFVHNTAYKNDKEYGYGYRGPGWICISGAISK